MLNQSFLLSLPQEQQPAQSKDEADHPRALGRCWVSFVHKGIKNTFVLPVVWTHWKIFDKSGGKSSCGEKWHFYLEQVKEVANFISVLDMIFLQDIMTIHHWLGSTEVGLEIGDRMWSECPGSSRKQETRTLDPSLGIWQCSCHSSFLIHPQCRSSNSMLLGRSLLEVGWRIVGRTIS